MKVTFCICKASPPDCPIHAPRQSKYRSQAMLVDGIRFQSKKEARHYQGLCLAQRAGELSYFLTQVPFRLPGGVVYRADFLEFWKDGTVKIVDTKGYRTQAYINKRKQVEALYPVTIIEA